MILSTKRSPLRNAARARTILGTFARHGFAGWLERARLGRFVIEKFSAEPVSTHSAAEHLRQSFEELGPTFVKLGQFLATRPDWLPESYIEEFKKLHDHVATLSFEQIKPELVKHFGGDLKNIFSVFDENPLAAASIAQVYQAQLHDGSDVVVKVRRPHIESIIEEDLAILKLLAEVLESTLSELRPYNLSGMVREFQKDLRLEVNFLVEANNLRRFSENFKNETQIYIPRVYNQYSGRSVLVMEKLNGTPMSRLIGTKQSAAELEEIFSIGMKLYLRMVFTHGLFHGDLHAGNLFVLPGNQIGLIDFGVVGRLSRRTQRAIAGMLLAIVREDYDRLAYEYIDLSPPTPFVDIDAFAIELGELISPYHGMSFSQMNLGRVLMDSTAVAARHRIKLPSELLLFFKSLIALEGLGRLLVRDFDLLGFTIKHTEDILASQFSWKDLGYGVEAAGRDLQGLLENLPRTIKQNLRRASHPQFAWQVRINDLELLRRSVDRMGRRIFLGLVTMGAMITTALLVNSQFLTTDINSLGTGLWLALAGAGMLLVWSWWR